VTVDTCDADILFDVDRETGEYEVAPKWKRYTLAIGAAGVGTAAVAWGTLAPSRCVSMTLASMSLM
jgi:hypothetical protein